MVHKFSKILSCLSKGISVGVGEVVDTCVGVRLGGNKVGVKVKVGDGISVDWGVEVAFPGKFLTTPARVAVGLSGGMKVRHAIKTIINGRKTRERALKFMNNDNPDLC